MKTRESTGKLICFTGIDGTGKTTNATNLVNALQKNGYNSKLIYGRLNPFLLRPFIFIGRKTILKTSDYSQYSKYVNNRQNKIKKHPILSKVYLYLLLFDTYFQLFFKVKIPKRRGVIIVTDRYIFDTVITDLSRFVDFDQEKITRIINKMFDLIGTPDLVFYLSVPPKICFERKNDVPNLEYLELLDKLYSSTLSRFSQVSEIDGTRSLEDILEITSKESIAIIRSPGSK